MSYPERIVPSRNFRKTFRIDDLLQVGRHYYLVRRTNKSHEEIFDGVTLREDALLIKDVPGMSLNLLGGFFEITDISFVPKPPASKYWDGGAVFLSDYVEFIQQESICFPLYFPLKDLHNQYFPFTVDATDKNLRSLFSIIEKNAVGGLAEVWGKSTVEHLPTMVNYWHVEFKIWRDKQGESEIKNVKINEDNPTWRQKAASIARNDILCVVASFEIANQPDKIPSEIYTKT